MSRPCAFSSRARAVIATVGDGLMRASASERKAMIAPVCKRAGRVLGSGRDRDKPGTGGGAMRDQRAGRGADRLRRLRIRSWRRGTREMDLILGGFADARARRPGAGRSSTTSRRCSTENDHDLYRWVAGAETCPRAIARSSSEFRRYHRIR